MTYNLEHPVFFFKLVSKYVRKICNLEVILYTFTICMYYSTRVQCTYTNVRYQVYYSFLIFRKCRTIIIIVCLNGYENKYLQQIRVKRQIGVKQSFSGGRNSEISFVNLDKAIYEIIKIYYIVSKLYECMNFDVST